MHFLLNMYCKINVTMTMKPGAVELYSILQTHLTQTQSATWKECLAAVSFKKLTKVKIKSLCTAE